MVAELCQCLGEAAFTAAWWEGQHLTLEDAVAEAHALLRHGNPPLGLTSREVEVLRLVAEGKTDREIAEALFVSRRTVSKHVEAILAKLEGDTRTAAASTAVRRGLA
jgi:DNA-binding NarL/FixJ family response regulator